MNILVDADACPVAIKEILYKAAERKKIHLTLVANSYLRTPVSKFIHSIKVAAGLDVADNEIVKDLVPGDLVITNDIPLAAKTIEGGGFALSPRGELHTAENIRSRLSVRDFMDDLRASGMATGGPSSMTRSDIQAFANQLDRLLTKHSNL